MFIAHEEEFARLNRRLLVVEQLMRSASVDPDGSPFTTAESSQFYYGVAELILEAREALRELTGAARQRVVGIRSG